MTTQPEPAAPWAHLPNANHIDRILADVAARPDVWAARGAAWDAVRGSALRRDANNLLDDAWRAAWGGAQAARGAAWGSAQAARDAARGATWDAVRCAAQGAVLVLTAWDDVAYILDTTPEGCRMLIEMCTDHHKHAAVLLLPAVIALSVTQGEST